MLKVMSWNHDLKTKVNEMEVSALSPNLTKGNGKRSQIYLRLDYKDLYETDRQPRLIAKSCVVIYQI